MCTGATQATLSVFVLVILFFCLQMIEKVLCKSLIKFANMTIVSVNEN